MKDKALGKILIVVGVLLSLSFYFIGNARLAFIAVFSGMILVSIGLVSSFLTRDKNESKAPSRENVIVWVGALVFVWFLALFGSLTWFLWHYPLFD